MLNSRNKAGSYYYSLSPQRTRKVGSRVIIFKTPYSKLLSPQPPKAESFLEQVSLSPFPSKKSQGKYSLNSNYKFQKDQKLVAKPIYIHNFIFPTSPVLAVVGVKEAMRDREWVLKARENLAKELGGFINASNGLEIEPPQSGYKYHLGKGNNMALIKQCFNSRWWWSEDTSKAANVVWIQGKSQMFFDNKEPKRQGPEEINENLTEKSVKCTVLFESDTLEEKKVDISLLGYDLITCSKSFVSYQDIVKVDSQMVKSHNKLEYNQVISNKKELYSCMKNYFSAIGTDMFEYIPVTFHVKNGENDLEFLRFTKYFEDQAKRSTWIIKPGENTNRGNGIVICNSLDQIKSELRNNPYPETGEHTYIIQKYIDKPFLVNKRKFDIRLYALITAVNGVIQCYFYQEGYIRTSCKDYNAKSLDNKFIHLTNDAIQKKSEDYGKYESGNKMSYKDFQKYLQNKRFGKDFTTEVLPIIKKIVLDTIKASFCVLDHSKRMHTFEIFGYDFLLDSDLKPWLLEVNTNPCLEISSTILARIIPAMLENAFKIAIDPIFPEPPHSPKRAQASLFQDLISENKFELIFHQAAEGKEFLHGLDRKGTLEHFLSQCANLII